VINRETKQLAFHVWYPGCPMEEDAFGIPKPKDTEQFQPQLLLVPCVGYGPRGPAPGLRRRLLRPHAGGDARRGR
jgi:5-formyltetrahydrofolate cyclo-ligase